MEFLPWVAKVGEKRSGTPLSMALLLAPCGRAKDQGKVLEFCCSWHVHIGTQPIPLA